MSSALYAYLYERNCLWKLNRNYGRFLHNCNFYLKHLGLLRQCGYWWLLPSWMYSRVLDRWVCIFGGIYCYHLREKTLAGSDKLIIDWAELVVQTTEFLRDHNEAQHVQINLLCSYWPCAPSIYFFSEFRVSHVQRATVWDRSITIFTCWE
jgi:hypothetical protein